MTGATLALTGGTGFVGRHLLRKAVAAGFSVRALTRKLQPAAPGVRWVAGDLGDSEALATLVEGADVVIHVAGLTNTRDPAAFERVNARGTARLVDVLGARPLVHVSSLAARRPDLSLYGASKLRGEEIAMRALPGRGPAVALRPPAIYGPGDTEFMALLHAARSGFLPVPRGSLAAMLYVEDLAEALLALAADVAGAARAAGRVMEIDDGAGGHDGAELAAAIGAALGRRIRPVALPPALLSVLSLGDTALSALSGRVPKLSRDRARYMSFADWSADSSALLALGLWRPQTGLVAGLKKTIFASSGA